MHIKIEVYDILESSSRCYRYRPILGPTLRQCSVRVLMIVIDVPLGMTRARMLKVHDGHSEENTGRLSVRPRVSEKFVVVCSHCRQG